MIKLKRVVKVKTFDVEGTVCVGRKKPEFLAVAQLAADFGRPLSGKDVAEELLGGLPTQIGWRVIDRCLSLGLLEKDNNNQAILSEIGRQMLEHKEVLVPEEGIWRFYYIIDPIIDEPFVHFTKLFVPNANDERKNLRNKNGSIPSGSELPENLKRLQDKDRLTETVKGNSFKVQCLSGKGEYGQDGEISLILSWNENELSPEVILSGEIDILPSRYDDKPSVLPLKKTIPSPASFNGISYNDLWCWLASKGEKTVEEEIITWIEKTGGRIMPISFSDTNEKDRINMIADLQIPPMKHQLCGEFNETSLNNIRMVPRTNEDAQQWLEWLQWRSIDAYTLPEQITHVAEILKEKFPYSKTEPLDADELLEKALNNFTDQRSRFLLAPYDLGLWR
ncbi:MAG TPA: hypothetical protein PLW78_07675 [bacterium]|nr:hypothetical protein [bacterium]